MALSALYHILPESSITFQPQGGGAAAPLFVTALLLLFLQFPVILRQREVTAMPLSPVKKTLLIPSLLDDWFPLLRYAFASEQWEPVLLDGDWRALEPLGLRHVHNDLCVPFVLITGQVLAALRSGAYDPARTGVLISQAGDACRGSCLIRLLRPVLDREGFSQVQLLSLNVRGIDRGDALPVGPRMALRARAALFWGDALAAMGHQVRPYEAVPGAAEALRRKWLDLLGEDLRRCRSLGSGGILRRCREMAADFRAVPLTGERRQVIAVTGDIYTKNCRLGNRDLVQYLETRGCEVRVAGMSWYALYYIDTHLDVWPAPVRLAGRALGAQLGRLQRRMLAILREAGFAALPPFRQLKEQARGLAPMSCALGAGWLMAAEMAGWIRAGCRKVLCCQSFGCLPGHICARGQYAALMRKLPGSLIVGVDFDPSTGEGTIQSRIRMLLDTELEAAPPV